LPLPDICRSICSHRLHLIPHTHQCPPQPLPAGLFVVIRSWRPISSTKQQTMTQASIFTKIFPERDAGCRIEECLGITYSILAPYNSAQLPWGLTTLQSSTRKAGDQLLDVEILVCMIDLGQYQNCVSAILYTGRVVRSRESCPPSGHF
jgi:hypothetical protein